MREEKDERARSPGGRREGGDASPHVETRERRVLWMIYSLISQNFVLQPPFSLTFVPRRMLEILVIGVMNTHTYKGVLSIVQFREIFCQRIN